MRQYARELARNLFDKAKSGELKAIGIDQIRAAIKADPRSNDYASDHLEEAVCRVVVELVV